MTVKSKWTGCQEDRKTGGGGSVGRKNQWEVREVKIRLPLYYREVPVKTFSDSALNNRPIGHTAASWPQRASVDFRSTNRG